MREEKYNVIDNADIASNSYARYLKHIHKPAIFGIVGGIFFVLFYINLFSNADLNMKNINNFFSSTLAKLSLKKTIALETEVNGIIKKNQDGKIIVIGEGWDNLKKFFEKYPFAGEIDYSSVEQKDKEKISLIILWDTKFAFNRYSNKFFDNISQIIILFMIGWAITFFISLKIWFAISKAHSKKYLEDQHITGTKILTEEELTELQKKDKVKGAIVGLTAKLAEEFETQHVFVAGSSGTGKTIFLSRIYAWLRKNRPNGKFIIHDTKGDWIAKHYNSETDYIFNFNDERSMNFNIFSVIKEEPDIKSIIATIIPRSAEEKDPIWTDTARDILEGIFLYCIKSNTTTNIAVKELIKLKPAELAKKLKEVNGAEIAVGHLTSSETQAGNFMSNFRSRAAFFMSVPDNLNGAEIDIENWIEKEGQSTIFLLNDTKNKDLNAVRIAIFVDNFVKTMLSMTESKTRRVYFLLDEMGSLSKMPTIVDGLALLRSYGGSFWIGIQEIQRLYDIYGKNLTSTIVNNTATKVILRSQEVETQKFCSDLIGEGKFKTTSITHSTGTETDAKKEGGSFAQQEKTEKAVLASEIGNMANNVYYYKNGSYDWTLIKTDYDQKRDFYNTVNEAYIKRKDLSLENLKNRMNKEVNDNEETKDEEKKEGDSEKGFGF